MSVPNGISIDNYYESLVNCEPFQASFRKRMYAILVGVTIAGIGFAGQYVGTKQQEKISSQRKADDTIMNNLQRQNLELRRALLHEQSEIQRRDRVIRQLMQDITIGESHRNRLIEAYESLVEKKSSLPQDSHATSTHTNDGRGSTCIQPSGINH